jgi:hypothetical protein
MSDADLFRQYAKEAMNAASKSTSEDEGRALIDLACTWARAALLGQTVLGSSFTPSPRDDGEAMSPNRS